VTVLAFISPTIEAFFIWQACVGIIWALTMKFAAWRVIGRISNQENKFDINELKSIWRFSAGMSGVAISGIILMQLDKVLLSRILSLEDFGRYTLAGVIANGLYIILSPTFNVIYPRLSALVVSGEERKLVDFYRTGTRLLTAVLFPLTVAAAVFSEEIIHLWTGNLSLALSAAPVASLFLIGTAFNGAMHFPYALQLAYGMARLPLKINIILVVIMIPTVIYLALHYGAVGGAAAWAILNFIYLLVGTWLTHGIILKGIGVAWLLSDVGIPLVLSLLVVGVMGTEIKGLEYSYLMDFMMGGALVIVSIALVVSLSANLRKMTRELLT
jgi:O-antigen/teichoic acid export membrane protein